MAGATQPGGQWTGASAAGPGAGPTHHRAMGVGQSAREGLRPVVFEFNRRLKMELKIVSKGPLLHRNACDGVALMLAACSNPMPAKSPQRLAKWKIRIPMFPAGLCPVDSETTVRLLRSTGKHTSLINRRRRLHRHCHDRKLRRTGRLEFRSGRPPSAPGESRLCKSA